MSGVFSSLRALGLSCFPLRWRDKMPRAELLPELPDEHGELKPSWRPYQKRLPDDAEVSRWDRARTNVAIATGVVSRCIVIDLDTADAERAIERAGGLPHTWAALTGKGRHIYLRHPGFEVRNRAKLLPGIDVRGDGGYVVAPPSIHPNGHAYEWEANPWDEPLAPPPVWLLELLVPPRPLPAGKPEVDADRSAYARAALERAVNEVRATAPGGRNHALNREAFSLATLVAAGELSRPEVERALIAAAGECGLSQREIAATLRSGVEAGLRHPREMAPASRRPVGTASLHVGMMVERALQMMNRGA